MKISDLKPGQKFTDLDNDLCVYIGIDYGSHHGVYLDQDYEGNVSNASWEHYVWKNNVRVFLGWRDPKALPEDVQKLVDTFEKGEET